MLFTVKLLTVKLPHVYKRFERMVYVMSAMSVSSGGVGWGYLLACLPFFPSTRSLHAWWVSSTTFIAYVAPMHLPGEDDGN